MNKLFSFEQRDRQKLQAERTEPRNRDYTKSCGNIPNGSSGRTNTQSDPSPINGLHFIACCLLLYSRNLFVQSL